MSKFDLHNDPKIESGFKIPENYFADFENRLTSQLIEKEPKTISLWKNKSVWVSSIAALFLVALGTILYYNTVAVSSIDESSLETYLANNVSQNDLIQQLDETDIQQLEKSLAVNNDAVERYLNENTTNLDFYLNE